MKPFNFIKTALLLILCAVLVLTTACGDEQSVSTPTGSSATSSAASIEGSSDASSSAKAESESSADALSNSQAASYAEVSTVASSRTTSSKTTSSKVTSSKVTSSKTASSKATSSKTTSSKTTSSKAPENLTPANTALTPIKASEFYGRTTLAKRSNGSALVSAYDAIVEGVGDSVATIKIDSKLKLNKNDIQRVVNYYRNDYPHHFWVGNSYHIQTTDNFVTAIKFEYTMSGSTLDKAKSSFDSEVKQILSGISGSWSQYNREKAIHDRLAARTTYADSSNSHTAYGAIVGKKAVCEGYCKAFQYLCYQAGIQCLVAIGESYNPSTNKSEAHAWNVVNINGSYYHVDITWNDQDNDTYYMYFNLTTKQIEEDHTVSTHEGYPLPSCTATAANYFTQNGGIISGSTFSAEAVGKHIKAGNGSNHFYISGDVDAFIAWYMAHENISQIADAAGITGGFSYQYSCIGREVICTIS